PQDRRNLQLSLTQQGRDVVETVMRHRQAVVTRLLIGIPPEQREALVSAFEALASSAGEIPDDGLWPITTEVFRSFRTRVQ
ncbi:MAG: hypothetical protein ACREP9_11170, partial [Candidatus Dormibacteraceae bacterium]